MTRHFPGLRAARRATCLIFLFAGVAMSSWAPMVPFAKSRLALDDGTLGLVLLALGSGGMVAMPLTGLLVARFGSRRVILAAGLPASALVPLLAVAPAAWALAPLLFLFGAAIGLVDVAMNAQAVAVEARAGRPIMSSFHGLYSLGGLVGSLGMSALLRLGMPLPGCALVDKT